MAKTITIYSDNLAHVEGFAALKLHSLQRPTLENVKVEMNDSVFRVTATDSYRLLRYEIVDTENLDLANKPVESVVVHGRSLLDALKTIRTTKVKAVDFTLNSEGLLLETKENKWALIGSSASFPNIDKLTRGVRIEDLVAHTGPRFTQHQRFKGILPTFNPEFLGDVFNVLGPTATVRSLMGPVSMALTSRDHMIPPMHFTTEKRGVFTVRVDYMLMPVKLPADNNPEPRNEPVEKDIE